MDFYTNVCRTRDKILVTGYQGNKKVKVQERVVEDVYKTVTETDEFGRKTKKEV